MTDLKFLLTTYSTAFATSGGGESELVQVAEILASAGVHVDIYGISSRPLQFYTGVIHFSVHADGEAIFREAIQRHKRVFLWPNVWWMTLPSEAEVARVRAMAERAHKVLFKSIAERENFTRYVPLAEERIAVIPTCVSDRFLSEPDRDLASTVCNASDYVLCMGLIEPVKNQLRLIEALGELGLDGVFVGGARDDDYFRQCTQAAHAGIQFLPFVQPCSALLRSIIANCAVMVEGSFDPPGRSTLEAAIMRKPLVLADGEWQREHFDGNVWYTPIATASALARAIQLSLTDVDRVEKVEANYHWVYSRHSAAVVGPQLVRELARESI